MDKLAAELLFKARDMSDKASQNPELRPTVSIDWRRNDEHAIRQSVVVGVLVSSTWLSDKNSHFRLFLQIKCGAVRSVEVNSQELKKGNHKTRLFIVARQYPNSSNNVAAFQEFPTGGTTTVQDFLNVIFERKMDQYQLSEQGSGCRYWCLQAMVAFEKAGLMPGGTSGKVAHWVSDVVQRLGMIPQETVQGQFY